MIINALNTSREWAWYPLLPPPTHTLTNEPMKKTYESQREGEKFFKKMKKMRKQGKEIKNK